MPYSNEISAMRDSVVAILRVHPTGGTKWMAKIAGTGCCIVDNHYILTAYHIFNDGKQRISNDRFYACCVPQNGPIYQSVPIISYPFEDVVNDMAILEIDPKTNVKFSVNSLDITFRDHDDGEPVITMGFPEPKINNAQVDAQFNWRGGDMFLKSYANEGIISAQFDVNSIKIYEFNVHWFEGESGGPIVSVDPFSVFAVMQSYRPITTPTGMVPGPRQGRPLSLIEPDLRSLGATIV